jgi:two-component system sensor histidine kinase KdpD
VTSLGSIGSEDHGRPRRGRPSSVQRPRHVAESLAHRLRTPLTIVRGGLALLDQAEGHMTAAERREVMAAVRDETERLVRVVDDLVVMLTPAGIPAPAEPVLLQRLLPTLLAGGYPHPVRAISGELGDDLPPVSGDPEAIGHAIRNLLVSAASVDPARAIRVTGRARAGRWVRLVVRSATLTAATRQRSGDQDAIDLAIDTARRLAAVMGGRLTVRRTRGYELALDLPVAREER